MGKIDILKRAIKKAELNGYVCPFEFDYETGRVMDRKAYYAIIFDADFCKALWGEEEKFLPYLYTHPHLGERTILWHWHVRQMVVCDDPMQYLEENMNKEFE